MEFILIPNFGDVFSSLGTGEAPEETGYAALGWLEKRGHIKVDSLHVTVTVDFLKSRLSLSTFLLRQSTHCRHIQCKILR